MRLGFSVVLLSLLCIFNAAEAARVVPDNKIVLSGNNSSVSVSFYMTGLEPKLSKKLLTKGIKAKLIVSKDVNGVVTVSEKKIFIPISSEGTTDKSQQVTFTLNEFSNLVASNSFSYQLKFPKKLQNKLALESFQENIFVNISGLSVSGKVQIPQADSSKFLSSGNVASPEGVEVNLIRFDEDEREVLIATTDTDVNGEYQFNFSGDNFSPDFMVSATAPDDTRLRAIVGSGDTDINPVSEFIFQEIENASPAFSDYNSEDVLNFIDTVESFNIPGAETIADSLDTLSEVANDFITNLIDAVDLSSLATSTEDLTGLYNFVLFDFGLFSRDIDTKTYNTCGLEFGELRFNPPVSGAVEVSGRSAVESRMDLFNDSVPGTSFSGYFLDSTLTRNSTEEAPGYSVSLGQDDSLTIVNPQEEEFFRDDRGDLIGFRSLVSTEKLYPAQAGVFMGTLIARGEEFVPDTLEIVGKEDIATFSFIFKKEDISLQSFDGNFGVVGFGAEFGDDGSTLIFGNLGEIEIFSRTIAASDFRTIRIKRIKNQSSTQLNSDGAVLSFTDFFRVDKNKITMSLPIAFDETIDLEGFANPQTNFFAVVGSSDERERGGRGRGLTEAIRELVLAVRLPSSTPNLSGTQYQINKIEVFFDGSLIEVFDEKQGIVTFSETEMNFTNQLERIIARDSDFSNINFTELALDDELLNYSVSNTGFIQAGDLENGLFEGYVSDDAEIIILRYRTEDLSSDSPNASMGLYILNKI
ncbi:MAG: hypothetical protein HRT47_10140 [Candidatus Caenarcaniphilales bacterium]|nr:hypothetical protein [Candidatus Caenarcaniphilales bacterium]